MRDAKRQTRKPKKQPNKARVSKGKRGTSLDELAKKPGHKHVDVDDLIGMGKDLWKSDKDFEEFVAGIYERRRQGRIGLIPEDNATARRKARPSKKESKRMREIERTMAKFWHTKSAEEIAREQGIRPVENVEEILGKGQDLWKSDEELDRFLADLRDLRQQG